MILIDTGPLLAFVNKRDQYHRWATKKFNALKQPLYSCEAVITETVYQLISMGMNPDPVLGYVTDKDIIIKPAFSMAARQQRIRRIIHKYNDLPADFADACLVNMYEHAAEQSKIFTIDSDFYIYRTQGGDALSLVVPG